MRKFLLLLALFCLLALPVLAQTYSFAGPYISFDLPNGVYDVVLTQTNLNTQTAYLAKEGLDAEAVRADFVSRGILLKAIDSKNGRAFVLTADQDVDAQNYFDINNQDDDTRKEFRLSHTNGTGYSILGYTYSSAAWERYTINGSVCRFLHTKYTFREGGKQVCTGYQLRTIYNGYTITLDMQALTHTVKEADDTALSKIMKTFTFTKTLPMPELPVKLAFTKKPAREVSEAAFTISGTSVKGASIGVSIISLSSAENNRQYSVTASSSGAFSVKVTLPAQGTYSVVVTAQAAGSSMAQRTFSVSYQRGILPVDLTLTPSATTGDETVIAGTTISGAKTQISVTGPLNYSKSSTSADFSFKLDTSAEGEYTIIVSVTKKGLNERLYTYTTVHNYTDLERTEKFKSSAIAISFDNLKKTSNIGKVAKVTGYVLEITPSVGEWVIRFAMTKSGSTYKNIVYLITNNEPTFTIGEKVVAYGYVGEQYSCLSENGAKIENFSRLNNVIFESAN